MLKVLFVASQILVECEPVFGVRFPNLFASFLAPLSVPTLSFNLSTGVECFFAGANYHSRLYLTTLGPLAIILLLAGAYEVTVISGRRAAAAAAGALGPNASGGEDEEGGGCGGGGREASWARDGWGRDSSWATDVVSESEVVVDEAVP